MINLHDYCHDIEKVKELLSNNDLSKEMLTKNDGISGYTPLHVAVCEKRDDILKQFLIYGGDPNAEANGLYTPLHIAASNGHIESIKLLLTYNANIKKRDEFGNSPYNCAKNNGRIEAARVLKSAEVKLAAEKGSMSIGRLIQDLQCGIDIEEDCFDEALEIAIKENHQRAAGYLILGGAKNIATCLSNEKQITPITGLLLTFHAVDIDDREMLTLLFPRNGHSSAEQILNRDVVITKDYFPKMWKSVMTFEQLTELRSAANKIEVSFPVSSAVDKGRFEAAEILVFHKYCDRERKSVDWHGLALRTIPDRWFEKIEQFQVLQISSNDINVFPQPITKMKKLLRLDLSHNRIESIPKEVLELPMLRNLNLSHNRIKIIPETDDWTKSMKFFDISDNDLKFLPINISLSCLKELNVARNKLQVLQLCICNISSLEALDISSNKSITVLPAELAKLTKLKKLEMNDMEQINYPPLSLRFPTTTLIRHLSACLRGSEPYFSMKLMLVGYSNRGKSTLLRRLNGDFEFKENVATSGVEMQDVVISKGIFDRKYTFHCWDFAGQEEYYATHQCFLSRRSIYLLIWRLTDHEDGIRNLRPWLDNLASRVPGSTIIFVGTHLDKVLQDDAYLESITENARDSIKTLLLAEDDRYERQISAGNLDSRVILVSNDPKSKLCRKSIETLRQCIYKAAEGMTNGNGVKVMGEMIPSSYLSLIRLMKKQQQEMQKNGEVPILRREKFNQLVLRNVSENDKYVMDKQDLSIATKFLHDIGIILHYDDANQGLRDLYFINPAWLCRLMALFSTVTIGNNLYKNGILAVEMIPLIIGRNNEDFPKKFLEQYLQLLYRFEIAFKVDEERILVPCMLSDPVTDNAINPSCNVLRRLHSFKYIPHGFWSRLLGRTLHFMKVILGDIIKDFGKDDSSFPHCWKTGIIFNHEKLYMCVKTVPAIIEGREAIATTVSESVLGKQVLTYIVDHIRTLTHEWYPGLSGHDGERPYVIQFVPCPKCCDDPRVAEPHLFDIRQYLLEGLNQHYITCPMDHQPREIDLRTACPDLMFEDLPDDLVIDSSDLSYLPESDHVLGEGNFGVTYRGLCREQRVAIKVYKLVRDNDGDALNPLDVFHEVRQEVALLRKLKPHDFFVEFLGVSLRPDLCSVMQLAEQGTLKQAIFTTQVFLKRAVVYKISRQIITALDFMHSISIIHGDLSLDNVLLFSLNLCSRVNVKLADFGRREEKFIDVAGLQKSLDMPGFIAPEMLEHSRTDEDTVKVDIYSYAIILSVLITEQEPYPDVKRVADIDSLVHEGHRPMFGDCTKSLYGYLTLTELMKVCWQTDPRKRPTSKEILLQSYSPLYSLLIGKIPLVDGYSPRQLCPLPIHREVWLMCDSPEGSFAVVIDMTKAFIKKTLKINTGKHFTDQCNPTLIDSIDSDHVIVVLGGNEDIVLIFNAEKKRQCAMIRLSESHLESVKTHEDLLLLGLHSGAFWAVSKKEFIKGKLKTLSTLSTPDKLPIRDLCCFDYCLYIATGKHIYRDIYTCRSNLNKDMVIPPTFNHNKSDIELEVMSIKCSPCCNYIYTSYCGGSTITKWTTGDVVEAVEVLDCAESAKLKIPAANAIDYGVTCFLPVHDTIWVGTGSGHIIIFTVPSTNEKASILTIFQPYRLELRSMTLYYGNGHGLDIEGDYDNIIVTTGKELCSEENKTAGSRCLIPLTAKYPQDEMFRKSSKSKKLVTNDKLPESAKVILLWQALPSSDLKELIGLSRSSGNTV